MPKLHKIERYNLVQEFYAQVREFEKKILNSEWVDEYEFEKIREGLDDLTSHLNAVLCAEYEEQPN